MKNNSDNQPFDSYEKETKPLMSNLVIKDVLIKKLSQELDIPLYIVRSVVDNQFKTTEAAINVHDTVELAGFGKFIFKPRRAITVIGIYTKQIERYNLELEKPTIGDLRKSSITGKIKSMESGIVYLNKKLNKNM